jgi:hypothetical protein
MEQHNLGWVELHLGKVDEAETRFRERDARAVGDAGDAWSSLNWTAVAAARGETGEAKRLFTTGKQSLEKLGVALDPDDQSELDWLSEQVLDRD